MKIDRIEALLWARVDGTIAPEELAELEAHLADHPEPSEIDRQISTISEELDNLEEVQPPPELRGRINDALASATPPTARSNPTSHIHSSPSWQARWLPLAASLVIGVAVGYLLHPGAGGSIEQTGVTGSMLTPTTQPAAVPVEIHLDAGTISASRSGIDIVVDLTLTAKTDLELTLASDGGPVSITSLNSTTQSTTEVTTDLGWVAIRTHGPGAVRLTASTANADELLRLQVSADGIPIEERWIGPLQNEIE